MNRLKLQPKPHLFLLRALNQKEPSLLMV